MYHSIDKYFFLKNPSDEQSGYIFSKFAGKDASAGHVLNLIGLHHQGSLHGKKKGGGIEPGLLIVCNAAHNMVNDTLAFNLCITKVFIFPDEAFETLYYES